MTWKLPHKSHLTGLKQTFSNAAWRCDELGWTDDRDPAFADKLKHLIACLPKLEAEMKELLESIPAGSLPPGFFAPALPAAQSDGNVVDLPATPRRRKNWP